MIIKRKLVIGHVVKLQLMVKTMIPGKLLENEMNRYDHQCQLKWYQFYKNTYYYIMEGVMIRIKT